MCGSAPRSSARAAPSTRSGRRERVPRTWAVGSISLSSGWTRKASSVRFVRTSRASVRARSSNSRPVAQQRGNRNRGASRHATKRSQATMICWTRRRFGHLAGPTCLAPLRPRLTRAQARARVVVIGVDGGEVPGPRHQGAGCGPHRTEAPLHDILFSNLYLAGLSLVLMTRSPTAKRRSQRETASPSSVIPRRRLIQSVLTPSAQPVAI